jgi:UDP-N-acetylmuramate--alanine ligase
MRLKYSVGVAGSHGKTTTTSMIAAIMERGGLDPTVIIGGQVKALDGGARVGKGQFLVAETDESDRSFLLLHPTIAVVTNIDHEHLEAYSSLTEMEQSFAQFVESVPFYGLAVLCVDDPKVREIADRYPKRKITFGFSPDADLRATNISFDRTITTFDVERDGDKIMSVALPIPGRHMASNALAAIAVGLEFGLSAEVIASALNGFRGVSRRIEIIGEEQGDYDLK